MGYVDYETFALMMAGLVAAFAAAYFFFFRVKMDPRVEALAEVAFRYAAEVLGVSFNAAKKGPPPVVLKKARWDGKLGEYKRISLPWGVVLWEKVSVVADASYIFQVLAHEMAHALRARAGKKVTEEEAYMVQAKARQYRLTDAEITALLAEF